MDQITIVPQPNLGSAFNVDGSAVSFDALLIQNAKMYFPTIPGVIFMLQDIDVSTITVNQVKQYTPYVDPNQVGEKLKFNPFTISFIVDKQFKNWSSIFNWMKAMTVDGSAVDKSDDPILILNNQFALRFTNSWPTSLGNITFSTTDTGMTYLKCNASFNYDYIDLLTNQTVDSEYQ